MPRKRTAAGDRLIVESPAKETTIERYPGPGSHVTARHCRVRVLPGES